MKALLLTFVAASALAAADDTPSISGKWQIHQNIADNESDQACTFTQKENELTGSCNNERASGTVTGKVDGKKVSWVYKSQYNGGPITLTYEGKLDANNKIAGTVTVEEYSVDGEFTATPAK